jgi:ribonucleoside-diphosphate reductase alpha chain
LEFILNAKNNINRRDNMSDASHFLNAVLYGMPTDQKREDYIAEVNRIFSMGLSERQANKQLINASISFTDIDSVQYDKVSTRTLLDLLYKDAAKLRGYNTDQDYTITRVRYGSFLDLVQKMTDMGLYGDFIMEKYSDDQIEEIGKIILARRDSMFTYVGLRMLADRYLARDFDDHVYELPQERFLIIAMTLMQNEAEDKRLQLITDAYGILSQLLCTVATPTLSNSGKPNGNLSSCFIDTVGDSLDSIYLDNWDAARISKSGGGVGIYFGKVRGLNSSIRGFKNKAGGVIPWLKNINNTAISVDQIGMRQGAISPYLDSWHWDAIEYLQISTTNGDERLKARDIFPGICIPDYMMELMEADEDGRMLTPDAPWYMFDPYEVRQEMGWSLEDCYDEQEGSGTWRTRYQMCIDNPNLRRRMVPIKEMAKLLVPAELETGMPYHFYRDEVNRQNANKHVGMIYCSNLCTEIAQNQSVSDLVDEYVVDENGDKYIIYKRKIGDLVVCNLASINLGKTYDPSDLSLFRHVVRTLVRMLDNGIDVNHLPLLQASETNKKYRAIGLGTFGWHHLLANQGIFWNDAESVSMADSVYEAFAFFAIEASVDLAEEKGSYGVFEGSEYNTGVYFERKGYTTEGSRFDWDNLKERAKKGMRNAYWGAVAPNVSTALIAGSTQGIDPFYGSQGVYFEEKKDFKLPVVAPDLTPETYPYYYKQSAHYVSQDMSIQQNAMRQRHIDQAISFNLYVSSSIKAKDLLELHRKAWRNKIKTTYYVRATANEVEDCEACQ